MFLFGPPNVKKMKARRNVKGLIEALGYQKDDRIGHAAAEALVEIGDPAVEPLIAALKNERDKVRQSAAKALGRIGDPRAVEPLIAALQDDHGHVRELSARALGSIGDPRAVEALIAVLQGKDYEYVREAAAEALGKIGDARAIEPLLAALQVWGLSETAAVALERLGWQPGRDEMAARYWLAKQDWEQCAALGTMAMHLCLALLEESARLGAFAQSMLNMDRYSPPGAGWGVIGWMEGEKCVEMREAAVKVLVKIGAPTVPLLIDKLQSPSVWMKMTIAWALGELKDARAVAPLIALLKDKKALEGGDCLCNCAPQAVIEALVKIGEPAVGPLIAELANDDKEIRERVAWALGEIRDVRAVEPLRALLKDRSYAVQQAAEKALQKIQR